MIKKIIYISSITFNVLLMQGCIPKIPQEQTPIDKKLSTPIAFPKYGSSINVSYLKKYKNNSPTAIQSWNQFFKDENLKSLINTALKNNQELKILSQEIYISQNEILDKKGEFLPKIFLGFGYETEKVGKYTSQGANDETAEYEPGEFVPRVLHNHQVGAFMSWEVDIWKKLRNAAKSSHLQYLANIELRKYLVTNLVAEISSTYYELKALDAQQKIVNEFIKNLQQAQYMVEAQKESARTNSLAVKRFEAEVLKNKSRYYEIKKDTIILENKLNTLLGRFPQKIKRNKKSLKANLPNQFSTGIPTKLLSNRPDVKKANYQLIAAKINIDVAKARFYPSLSIDAGAGYEAFNQKYFLYSPESVFYNIAARATAPLINRNAIKADYFSANSKQIKAIYEYHQTFIKAYNEVSNELARINNLSKISALREKQVEALDESVNISNLLFKAARSEYIELLLTKRDLLEASMELVEINKKQMLSYISLYKALGGGWR